MAATPPVPTFAPGIAPTSLISAITTVETFLMNPPICVVRQTIAQSLSTGANTAIAFDTTDVDSVSGHSNSTNNSRYTAVYAGWYGCSGGAGFAPSASGQRAMNWSVNGTLINATGTWTNAASSGGTNVPAPGQLIFLNVGDYVELKAFQNTGGALNTQVAATGQPVMSIWRVSS